MQTAGSVCVFGSAHIRFLIPRCAFFHPCGVAGTFCHTVQCEDLQGRGAHRFVCVKVSKNTKDILDQNVRTRALASMRRAPLAASRSLSRLERVRPFCVRAGAALGAPLVAAATGGSPERSPATVVSPYVATMMA